MLQQLEMQCLVTYLPQGASAGEEVKMSWMWSMLSIPNPGRALSASFAALCLARTGIVQNDQEMISQGRAQYARGLALLQQALYEPELAFQDRTLAAIRTLSIYEVRPYHECC